MPHNRRRDPPSQYEPIIFYTKPAQRIGQCQPTVVFGFELRGSLASNREASPPGLPPVKDRALLGVL